MVTVQPPFAGAAYRVARAAGWGLDALLAVLLAPTCPLCRTLLDRPTRGLICPACWNAVPRLTPPGTRSLQRSAPVLAGHLYGVRPLPPLPPHPVGARSRSGSGPLREHPPSDRASL